MPLVDGKGFVETSSVLDSITTLLTDSVKAIDSTLHVEVDAFYEGNKYFATTYQDFTDVRLVFCVPKSMGKFGGETDNCGHDKPVISRCSVFMQTLRPMVLPPIQKTMYPTVQRDGRKSLYRGIKKETMP